MKLQEKMQQKPLFFIRLFWGLSALFSLTSVLMMFLPAFRGTGKILGTAYSFSGAEAIFGIRETVGKVTVTVLSPNLLSILAFTLPLLGLILTLLPLLPQLRKFDRIFSLLSALFLSMAAIFAFLSPLTFESTVIGSQFASLYTWEIGIGTLLSAFLSILSALLLTEKSLLLSVQ